MQPISRDQFSQRITIICKSLTFAFQSQLGMVQCWHSPARLLVAVSDLGKGGLETFRFWVQIHCSLLNEHERCIACINMHARARLQTVRKRLRCLLVMKLCRRAGRYLYIFGQILGCPTKLGLVAVNWEPLGLITHHTSLFWWPRRPWTRVCDICPLDFSLNVPQDDPPTPENSGSLLEMFWKFLVQYKAAYRVSFITLPN